MLIFPSSGDCILKCCLLAGENSNGELDYERYRHDADSKDVD